MKYGYRCKCGWSMSRGDQTRKQYSTEKKAHAETCEHLKKELEQSARANANPLANK